MPQDGRGRARERAPARGKNQRDTVTGPSKGGRMLLRVSEQQQSPPRSLPLVVRSDRAELDPVTSGSAAVVRLRDWGSLPVRTQALASFLRAWVCARTVIEDFCVRMFWRLRVGWVLAVAGGFRRAIRETNARGRPTISRGPSLRPAWRRDPQASRSRAPLCSGLFSAGSAASCGVSDRTPTSSACPRH